MFRKITEKSLDNICGKKKKKGTLQGGVLMGFSKILEKSYQLNTSMFFLLSLPSLS